MSDELDFFKNLDASPAELKELINRGIAEVKSNLEEDAEDPITGSGEGKVSFDFVVADEGTVDPDFGTPVIGKVDIIIDGETATLFNLGSIGPIAQSVEDQSALMNFFSTAANELIA